MADSGKKCVSKKKEKNTRYSVFVQNETQYLVDFKKWVCYNRLDARTMELFGFRVGQPILAG